jgi:hypothetical protein
VTYPTFTEYENGTGPASTIKGTKLPVVDGAVVSVALPVPVWLSMGALVLEPEEDPPPWLQDAKSEIARMANSLSKPEK